MDGKYYTEAQKNEERVSNADIMIEQRVQKPKKPGEKKIVINVWVKEKHTKQVRREADKLENLFG